MGGAADTMTTPIKVIAFDVFNTIVDLSSVPREEVRAYADHIRKPEWSPLALPKSWETLPAFLDSREGVAKLARRFTIATCSNGPADMQQRLLDHNGIKITGIVDLAERRVYKPNALAYRTICDTFKVEPSEVLMVTANPGFGDVEGSARVGMESVVIRGRMFPTIPALAEHLQRIAG